MIGHSMGANTAAVLASTFPELVSAVVLEDPPWRDSPDSGSVAAHAAERAKQSSEQKKMSPEEFLQAGKTENPTWRDEEFEPWIEAKYQVSQNVFSYMTQGNVNWRGAVEKIQCPTLMLTADPELGARITPEVAAKVRAANPNIEIVNIPGAGHNIRREQLSAYLDAVQAFLARVYPSS
jgi:N-formylmaleamate deformylase